MRLSLALALALVLAAPAALACPTELGAGLVHVDAGGTATTVSQTDRADVLREVVRYAEGDGYEIEALHGLFELSLVDLDGAGAPIAETRETTAYPVPPALPEPGSVATGILAQVTTGDATYARTLAVTAGAPETVRFGACRYEGYRVDLRAETGGDWSVQTYLRVPALGVSVLVGYADAEGAEHYEIVSIAPAPSAPATKLGSFRGARAAS